MPIYEYICGTCEQRFEKLVRFGESADSPECPVCHAKNTRKQVSRIAVSSASGEAGSSAAGASCGGGGRFT